MKQIPLTLGKFTIVDDEDYRRFSQHKWYTFKNRNTYYAVRHVWQKGGKTKSILMHREILGLKAGDSRKSDHRDGNGLNNLRENLRICTHIENSRNRHAVRGTSKYKGVHRATKRGKKWQVGIRYNNKYIHLGSFTDEVEAAKVYDIKAKELFGEFAYTNF